MEEILESNRALIAFSTLVGVFLFAFVWEALWPRRAVQKDLRSRWLNNIGLTILNHVISNWINVAVAVAAAWWVSRNGNGLLTRLDVGLVLGGVVSFIVFSLLSYVEHRLLHAIPWLWRMHAVHHSDTEFDVTTTYRSHPLEMVFVSVVSLPVILLLGPPVAVVVLYQVARVTVNIFAHSNIYIPESVERWLRYVVVTPDFHRLHHLPDQRYTDSNFSTLLPWFDYLFGTATRKPFKDHPSLTIGLEYFRAPGDSRIDRLLLMPFRWRREEAPQEGVQRASA